MNAFLQTIIKLFLRLFNAGRSDKSGQPNTSPPSTSPMPKPQPKPIAEQPPASEEPAPPTPEPEPPTPEQSGPISPDHGLQFNEVAREDGSGPAYILISDGEVEGKFRYYKKGSWAGWYTGGKSPIKDFIQAEGELLRELKMTRSSQNLLQAVSENEGKLEAINAYDGAFLSFGIFQWTLGVRDTVGELPALLNKLRDTYPDTFYQYFGRFGLGLAEQTNALTGYLTYNGQLVKDRAVKEQFRSKAWVYRFWRAGQDRLVQAIEVEHALSRLKAFYWRYKVHGHTLNKIVTSEYGVALLLDNHVNLPGLVKRAIKAAMDQAGLNDPTNWGTDEERRILEAYVAHRATKVDGVGPMYDAKGRAKRTAAYVGNSIISDERGTFRYSHTTSRSLENHIPEPDGFNPADYPDLELDLEGRDLEFLSGEVA